MVVRLALSLLAALLAVVPARSAAAPRALSLADAMVRVCPVVGDAAREPDFASATCSTQRLWTLDPQGRQLWVELTFEAGDDLVAAREPLGLFIHAKAASAAWLNGQPLGVNGVPGGSASEEVPGLMDAVLFVPRTSLRAGANRLVLRMSAMHGAMRLSHPVHDVVLAPYRSAGERIMIFIPALVTFGLFLAGVAFFGESARRGYDREGSACLAVASLAAALQLIVESSRHIVSYPYPWHEVRLVLVLLCANVLALGLLAYIMLALFAGHGRARVAALGGTALAIAGVVWMVQGFDGKTLMVPVVAAGTCAVAGLVAWRRGAKTGVRVAALALALAVAMLLVGPEFLDLHLYIGLAALLLWLFARQAQQVALERAERQREGARARELAKALARAEAAHRPLMLEVSQGNRTDYVAASDIRHLAGAGDYVEAHWGEGRSGLCTGSLVALEDRLPPGFIRTHRSHIVNAAHVTRLERDAAGTGRLVLSDGSEVPVSRRIMPEVRRSLG